MKNISSVFRRGWLLALTGLLLTTISVVPVAGRDPVTPVNSSKEGVAIKGYDAVAYFEQSRPVLGNAKFMHQWMGSSWHFASVADRDQFAANPERYAPQFGGYCSRAVNKGYTADIDPDAWTIINGKLYLNYSRSVQKEWEQDVVQRISDAEKNWPTLHSPAQ